MDNLEHDELIRFSTGREASWDDLYKYEAGRTLTALARQHMDRKGGSFSDALHAVATICPGEIKAYLNLKLPRGTDDSFRLPRGVGKKVSKIVFRALEGWTEEGVKDWLKQQVLTGGELARNEGGWSYTPRPGEPFRR